MARRRHRQGARALVRNVVRRHPGRMAPDGASDADRQVRRGWLSGSPTTARRPMPGSPARANRPPGVADQHSADSRDAGHTDPLERPAVAPRVVLAEQERRARQQRAPSRRRGGDEHVCRAARSRATAASCCSAGVGRPRCRSARELLLLPRPARRRAHPQQVACRATPGQQVARRATARARPAQQLARRATPRPARRNRWPAEQHRPEQQLARRETPRPVRRQPRPAREQRLAREQHDGPPEQHDGPPEQHLVRRATPRPARRRATARSPGATARAPSNTTVRARSNSSHRGNNSRADQQLGQPGATARAPSNTAADPTPRVRALVRNVVRRHPGQMAPDGASDADRRRRHGRSCSSASKEDGPRSPRRSAVATTSSTIRLSPSGRARSRPPCCVWLTGHLAQNTAVRRATPRPAPPKPRPTEQQLARRATARPARRRADQQRPVEQQFAYGATAPDAAPPRGATGRAPSNTTARPRSNSLRAEQHRGRPDAAQQLARQATPRPNTRGPDWRGQRAARRATPVRGTNNSARARRATPAPPPRGPAEQQLVCRATPPRRDGGPSLVQPERPHDVTPPLHHPRDGK